MSGVSFKSRLFLKLLKRTHGGTLFVTLPDGSKDSYGEGAPLIQVQVKSWQTLDDLLDKGDLGLAEAAIRGDLVVDDMASLVQWACRNEQAMDRFLHGTWYGTWMDRMRRFLTQNSREGAKKNIMAHYDLGNDFYSLWLDNTMTYSSAIFKAPGQTLEEAQKQKYDRIIQALNIKEGDHVLEIGCGWGGFFSRAVETTGCKVTAVMNSPAQAQYNKNLIAKKGFVGHVDLKQMDYRDIEGRYDKIVSIEMIEAVGEKYWDSFFGKVSASLKDKGEALIQAITIDDNYFDSYRKRTDFIQRYVFPGGMLLAPQVFMSYAPRKDLKVDTPFEFGLSYADTLRKWKENFIGVESQIQNMGFDEKFMRLWKLYLDYCEGAFRAERINVGHYQLQK